MDLVGATAMDVLVEWLADPNAGGKKKVYCLPHAVVVRDSTRAIN
jgi:DNA-binding LacI/PurR family transcriptional regulator